MRMRFFPSSLLALALLTTAHLGAATGATNEISYEITDADTLYVVATRYYGAPAAYRLIFKRNEASLREAYDKHAKEAAQRGETVKPFGTATIWPKTTI